MSNIFDANERAIVGDNSRTVMSPEELTAFLTEQYTPTETTVTALLAEARAKVPAVVDTDEVNGIVSKVYADIRDELKKLEAQRVGEKAPYLAATRAIDAFFGAKADRLEKAGKVVYARSHDFNVRKEAAERAERDRIFREAQAAAAKAAKEAAAAIAAEQEAAAKAARARNPERIDALKEIAQEAASATEAAKVEAIATHEQAVAAHHAAIAKPADLVRERHDSGVMSTMQTEGFAEVVDRNKLDFSLLAPHFKIEHIEAALKKLAAQNDYKITMPGANIGKRPKTVIK